MSLFSPPSTPSPSAAHVDEHPLSGDALTTAERFAHVRAQVEEHGKRLGRVQEQLTAILAAEVAALRGRLLFDLDGVSVDAEPPLQRDGVAASSSESSADEPTLPCADVRAFAGSSEKENEL